MDFANHSFTELFSSGQHLTSLPGANTTAILLRMLFYQLLTHPHTMGRLLDELDKAAASGNLDELASWKQTHDLPYLDSCVKEAGRLHPPFGLPLERVVPAEGAWICGQWLKGGTVVGMSAWVVHRNQDVFGHDCDKWRPERWLCEKEERRRMENSLLTVSFSYIILYRIAPVLGSLIQTFRCELLGMVQR